VRAVCRSLLLALVPLGILFGASPLSAGQIRGRLLLRDKPAAGVTIVALPHEMPHDLARRMARSGEEPKPFATCTTGPDGTFVLAVPAEPARSFVIRATGGGTRAVEFDGIFETGETADLGEHLLEPGETLTGTVVDRAGQPVAGAEVTLRAGAPGDPDLLVAPAGSMSGPDGTFHLDGASAAGNKLRVEQKGYAPVSEANVRAGGAHKPFVLAPGVTFAGTVKPLPGKSAAGVLVRVEGRAETRWVETGADGSFTIPNAPEGTVKLVADAGETGYGEQPGLVLPLAEGKTALVTLSPPSAIEGRVVDAKSLRAVPRAKVSVGRGASRRSVRSGPDGRYRLPGLAPGTYRFEAD